MLRPSTTELWDHTLSLALLMQSNIYSIAGQKVGPVHNTRVSPEHLASEKNSVL